MSQAKRRGFQNFINTNGEIVDILNQLHEVRKNVIGSHNISIGREVINTKNDYGGVTGITYQNLIKSVENEPITQQPTKEKKKIHYDIIKIN